MNIKKNFRIYQPIYQPHVLAELVEFIPSIAEHGPRGQIYKHRRRKPSSVSLTNWNARCNRDEDGATCVGICVLLYAQKTKQDGSQSHRTPIQRYVHLQHVHQCARATYLPNDVRVATASLLMGRMWDDTTRAHESMVDKNPPCECTHWRGIFITCDPCCRTKLASEYERWTLHTNGRGWSDYERIQWSRLTWTNLETKSGFAKLRCSNLIKTLTWASVV